MHKEYGIKGFKEKEQRAIMSSCFIAPFFIIAFIYTFIVDPITSELKQTHPVFLNILFLGMLILISLLSIFIIAQLKFIIFNKQMILNINRMSKDDNLIKTAKLRASQIIDVYRLLKSRENTANIEYIWRVLIEMELIDKTKIDAGKPLFIADQAFDSYRAREVLLSYNFIYVDPWPYREKSIIMKKDVISITLVNKYFFRKLKKVDLFEIHYQERRKRKKLKIYCSDLLHWNKAFKSSGYQVSRMGNRGNRDGEIGEIWGQHTYL